MRNNAMKTCAAGAMLFGGTLGAVETANADITWTQVSSTAYAYQSGGGFDFVDKDFSNFLSTQTASVAGYSSASLGAFSSSGFSLSATAFDGGAFSVYCNHTFTVTGTLTVVLSGMGGAGGANGYSLYGPSSFSWTSVGESGAFSSGELVLQAGVYNISGGVYASEPTGGPITLLDFAIVPAPGAIALLGVAGLVGRRRRA